jgi:ribose 5-phosphate isomerase B
MRVVVGADEALPVVDAVIAAVGDLGCEAVVVGPAVGGTDEWADVAATAARMVAAGDAGWGVVLCWSGTGAAIAANKIAGVRAALCGDAETARLARKYNHANVLALSMRLTTTAVAVEIVRAFADTPYGEEDFDTRNVARVDALDGPRPGSS